MSMTSRCGRALAQTAIGLALGAGLLHCSTGSAGGDADAGMHDDRSAAAEQASACPDDSVAEVPSGACSGGAGCAFAVKAVCGPGVKAIPEGHPVYVCDCEAGTWQCTMQSGTGFGLIFCDAGAD
jgi:hypothetical protein